MINLWNSLFADRIINNNIAIQSDELRILLICPDGRTDRYEKVRWTFLGRGQVACRPIPPFQVQGMVGKAEVHL